MNMLDRVADAIRLSTDFTQDIDWENMEDWQKDPWIEKAKSVLTSMAELDETIALAGVEAYDGADPCDSARDAMGTAWTAMINTALEGK